MKILPWLAASAVDDPEMPAKNTDNSTLICARSPGKLPTIVRDSRTRRSVMPPTFIRLAVSRKKGTASRMNELYALNVVLNITIGDRRGSMKRAGRQARPSANATGTRRIMKKKNVPNSHMAATVGVSVAPVMAGPPDANYVRLPPDCVSRRRSYDAALGQIVRRRLVARAGPEAHDAYVLEDALAAEQQPGKPRQRPRDEQEGHRHLRQFRLLVPAERHEPDAVPDEHQGEHQDEYGGDDAQQGVGARLELGPHVALEMR